MRWRLACRRRGWQAAHGKAELKHTLVGRLRLNPDVPVPLPCLPSPVQLAATAVMLGGLMFALKITLSYMDPVSRFV
jgi:hypothetical protein